MAAGKARLTGNRAGQVEALLMQVHPDQALLVRVMQAALAAIVRHSPAVAVGVRLLLAAQE